MIRTCLYHLSMLNSIDYKTSCLTYIVLRNLKLIILSIVTVLAAFQHKWIFVERTLDGNKANISEQNIIILSMIELQISCFFGGEYYYSTEYNVPSKFILCSLKLFSQRLFGMIHSGK